MRYGGTRGMIFVTDANPESPSYDTWLLEREKIRSWFAQEFQTARDWRAAERKKVEVLRDDLSASLKNGTTLGERFSSTFRLSRLAAKQLSDIETTYRDRVNGMQKHLKPVSRGAAAVDFMRANFNGYHDDPVVKTLVNVERRENGKWHHYHRDGKELVRAANDRIVAANGSHESSLAAFILAKERCSPPLVVGGSPAFVESLQRLGQQFGVEVLTNDEWTRVHGQSANPETMDVSGAEHGAAGVGYGAATGKGEEEALTLDRDHATLQRVKAEVEASIVALAPRLESFKLEGRVAEVEPKFFASGETAVFVYRQATKAVVVIPLADGILAPIPGSDVNCSFNGKEFVIDELPRSQTVEQQQQSPAAEQSRDQADGRTQGR